MLRACCKVVHITTRHLTSSAHCLPVLTLYTKDPCPLCDVAKEKISVLEERFQFETVDITATGNEDWWEKYKYDIPVFHFQGEYLMKHRANVKLLESAIEKYEQENH